jgi:cyclopropane-fatty-acyl-phospholipid synthase
MIVNRQHMDNFNIATAAVGRFLNYMSHTRLANTIANAINNISAHYDLGNELFTSFLDSSMMYSSAVWGCKDESLNEAQMRKIDMMIRKANICSSDEVLEIGTGWGGFAIEVSLFCLFYCRTLNFTNTV